MVFRNKQIVSYLFLGIDILILILSYFISLCISLEINFVSASLFDIYISEYIVLLWSSVFVLIIGSFTLNLQHVPRRRFGNQFFSPISFKNYFLYPQLLFAFVVVLIILIFNFDNLSRFFVLVYYAFQFIFSLFFRLLRVKLVRVFRVKGFNHVQLVILGSEKSYFKAAQWLKNNRDSGFYIKNQFKGNFNLEKTYKIVSNIKSGDYFLIDPSFISLSKKETIKLINLIEDRGAYIFYIIHLDDFKTLKASTNRVGPFNVVAFRKMKIKKHFNQINKRIFDVCFSLLFLVLVYWWVYIIVCIGIKLSDPGPIIFRQIRIGKKGKPFYCYKFRSMKINQGDLTDKLVTSKKDNRIFKFGSFLRKTNIDEFPQFLNVLFGSMSVVGPRPHMKVEDIRLARKIDKYRLRYWVKPGITGYAAISGFRGGTEDMSLIQKRINYDIEYIENWSFFLDIKICFLTAIETLFYRGKGY